MVRVRFWGVGLGLGLGLGLGEAMGGLGSIAAMDKTRHAEEHEKTTERGLGS